MALRFFNTLSRSVQDFVPLDPDGRKVGLYCCGPTVYDYAHIGNFKTFLFADVLRRFLELTGHAVHQVMNLTDVGHMTEDQLADGGGEDKMQVAARRLKEAKKTSKAPIENPDDPYQVAQFYIDAFLEDARALGLKIADEYPEHMPRATQHVAQMQAMIRRLIDKGHAYVAADGAVYYSVESFPDYGKLSGNTLDKLRGGAGGRILEEHQKGKRHPADFLLWKPDPTHVMKWDSPWGPGYPGWHIECSAMATTLLGREVIDIHTGGEDNIFPHHECEIAQTCGASGNASFARLWMHSRYLLVEGEKMSKSKGNFYTVRDVLAGKVTGRAVDPAVFRYALIRAHYRSNLDFSAKVLEESAGAVRKLRDAAATLEKESSGRAKEVGRDHPMVSAFVEALSDDLNIAGALAGVFSFVNEQRGDAAECLGALRAVDRVLGVLQPGGDAGGFDAQAACRAIDAARAAKDFATADRLRKKLTEAGYDVLNTKEGTVARKKLA